MTLRIFHSINFIKQIKEFPKIYDSKKIDFKFKKPGYSRLIVFDLDETLIHTKRNLEDLDQEELHQLYGNRLDAEPDAWV